MVKCEKCGKNVRTLKGHVCEEVKPESILRRHETFLHQRLQKYNNLDVNKMDEADIASLMKAFRIFVEQNVRRIAFRQGWTWASPNVRVKNNKGVKKSGSAKSTNSGKGSK
jgi:hypothetical protein